MEQQAAIWPVQVDPGQLENSILNLAINGRDAMDGRGVLTLATRNATLGDAQPAPAGLAAGDYVVIEVRDDGCGMPADVVKRAFEPFFTTKDAGKGTGLGLAMVYGFAQQSGGTAVIQSAPGAGTTVQLWFPRAWAAPAMAERVFPADGQAVPRGTETILIVEDETDVRETTRVALEALGYQVLEAADGAAALAILESPAPVQAVFSDVMLRGTLRGTDVIARARELRPGIAALLTTGFADTTVLGQVMVDRSVEVLAKPYTIEDLARRVRATLDGEPDSD
jgi:CheY-like chemotaxis protein